jgi:hypothetical protein
MAHFPAVLLLGLFLILGHSTYSAAGLPVEYQLEELEENNVIRNWFHFITIYLNLFCLDGIKSGSDRQGSSFGVATTKECISI